MPQQLAYPSCPKRRRSDADLCLRQRLDTLEGEPAHELKVGEVFNIPPNVKHWHGAAKDSWFQHLSLEVPGEGTSNEWLEPVTDEVYDKLP